MRMSDFSKSPPDPLFCMKVTQNSVPFVSWGGCAAASTAGSSSSARRRVFHPEPVRPADNPFPFVPHRRTRRIIDSPFSFSRSFVQSGSPSLHPPQQEQRKPYTRIRIAACPAGCSCRISFEYRIEPDSYGKCFRVAPGPSVRATIYAIERLRIAAGITTPNISAAVRGPLFQQEGKRDPNGSVGSPCNAATGITGDKGSDFIVHPRREYFAGQISLHRNDRRTGSIVTRALRRIFKRGIPARAGIPRSQAKFRTDSEQIRRGFQSLFHSFFTAATPAVARYSLRCR